MPGQKSWLETNSSGTIGGKFVIKIFFSLITTITLGLIDADNYDLLQHPFIAGYDNKKEILNLIMESKAEVVETVEDLPEDEEIIEMKVCNLLQCIFMICCKSH